MNWPDVLLTLGVFAGGALPWLEAIVVIPAGIIAGLHPAVALLAGVTGNLLTVALFAWWGERLRAWWLRRRSRGTPEPVSAKPETRRARWTRALVQRWGMPALAVVGPLGLGTQLSAVVAVGFGVSARAAFAWVGAGTVGWSIVAAGATVAGLSIAGVGA